MAGQIGDLPNALSESEALARRFTGKQSAVFLDYDGTLTQVRDRPEEAVISDSMREAVRGLYQHVRSLFFDYPFYRTTPRHG